MSNANSARTLRDLIILTKARTGSDENLASSANFLIQDVLGIGRTEFYSNPERTLTAKQVQKVCDGLDRLIAGEPLAYIVERQEFYGRIFEVNPDVLIPRPDTEALVEATLEAHKKWGADWRRGLDIGTGSGCIAVTLAKTMPQISWTGWDKSEGALKVARKNAAYLDSPVTFAQVDIVSFVEQKFSGELFDLIVSNPPYIADEEDLDKSVRDFEPHLALFSPKGPLFFYQLITEWSGRALNDGGYLAFEIAPWLATDVQQIMKNHGFSDIMMHRDLENRDRVVSGVRRWKGNS
jgi:release factor glutamine methyltransferase